MAEHEEGILTTTMDYQRGWFVATLVCTCTMAFGGSGETRAKARADARRKHREHVTANR